VTCSLCDRVALYTSGAFFYCKDHQIEAKRMALIVASNEESMRAASTGHWGNRPSGRRNGALARSYASKGGYGRRG
jgi:hypothetical protein